MNIKRYLTGPLEVNTYLAYDNATKKAFMVDPGGYSSRITDFVKAEGLDVEYIILTHGHGDHIGGVEGFKKDFPDAKVVAHEREKDLLGDCNLNLSLDVHGEDLSLDADIYVADGHVLKVGGMELEIIFTPGHTEGGMCIYCDGKLFSGDTLFRYSVGRTDFPGGDMGTLLNSIRERLFVLPGDTQVFPGHMEATTIETEKRGNPFV